MGVSGHQNVFWYIFAYISTNSVQANMTAVASCTLFCQKHLYDIYVSWLKTSHRWPVTGQRPASLSLVVKVLFKAPFSLFPALLSTDPQPKTRSTLLLPDVPSPELRPLPWNSQEMRGKKMEMDYFTSVGRQGLFYGWVVNSLHKQKIALFIPAS